MRENLVTTAEAGLLIGRSPEAIRWYVRQGHLKPSGKIMGRDLYARRDVLKLKDKFKPGRPRGSKNKEDF